MHMEDVVEEALVEEGRGQVGQMCVAARRCIAVGGEVGVG